jgi:glycosyltransferase involved in cell wall biosynthesis
MPKISVIIPAYNAEKTIKRTLDSILNQSFSDFEVLIIDDGSKDKTAEICKEIAKADNRVKVISKENGGVSSARNLGLETALGEYIYFCDSDDEVMPDGLKSLIDVAEKENADIVVGGHKEIKIFDGSESISVPCKDLQIFDLKNDNSLILDFLTNKRSGLNSLCYKIISAKVIKENDLKFDLKRTQGEDWAFTALSLYFAEKIILIPDIIYKYYLYEENHGYNFSKYKGDIAYCLVDGTRIKSQLVEKFNIDIPKEDSLNMIASEFLLFVQAVKHHKERGEITQYVKPKLNDKYLRDSFKRILKLNKDELMCCSISRREKIIALLLLLKMPNLACRFYKI